MDDTCRLQMETKIDMMLLGNIIYMYFVIKPKNYCNSFITVFIFTLKLHLTFNVQLLLHYLYKQQVYKKYHSPGHGSFLLTTYCNKKIKPVNKIQNNTKQFLPFNQCCSHAGSNNRSTRFIKVKDRFYHSEFGGSCVHSGKRTPIVYD